MTGEMCLRGVRQSQAVKNGYGDGGSGGLVRGRRKEREDKKEGCGNAREE